MSIHDQIDAPHTTNDYPHQVRAFQAHAGVFAVTMVIIFAVNLFVNLSAGVADQWSAWWSVWALIGWTSGIAVHGLVVFLAKPSNGS
ncbi:MAG: 2TM domain-containing protein [Actinomycetota bacterium]